jgi:hypothetical protein
MSGEESQLSIPEQPFIAVADEEKPKKVRKQSVAARKKKEVCSGCNQTVRKNVKTAYQTFIGSNFHSKRAEMAGGEGKVRSALVYSKLGPAWQEHKKSLIN